MWTTTEIQRPHLNQIAPRNIVDTFHSNLHQKQMSYTPTNNKYEHPILRCIDPKYDHQYQYHHRHQYQTQSNVLSVNDVLDSITCSESDSTIYSNSTATSTTSGTMNSDENNELIGYNEENLLFANRGFRKLERLNASDTTSGIQLFKAEQIQLIAHHYPAVPVECYAFIKKINKRSMRTQENNIVKEAIVLSHLTVDNNPSIGNHLVKFIDFFQNDDAYYLVTEYVEGMTLKRFIRISHEYVNKKRLKLRDLKRVMKYIMFQLLVTLRWLHDVYHCCHLNLLPENIILQNSKFIKNGDGSVSLADNISVKLAGFNVAEVFDVSSVSGNGFKCCKHAQNADHHYDGRSADMWSYGMIFYQCMTGKVLNTAEALKNGDLVRYLEVNNVLNQFTKDSLNLLCKLLDLKQRESLNAFSCLKDGYFKTYRVRYEDALNKKMKKDMMKLKQQTEKMRQFPYYKL